MPLPDSITLNDGVDNEVYANKVRNGSSVSYFAPSPAGDLAGRPTLTISHEITKAGVAKATTTLVRPVLNSTSGKYESFHKQQHTSTCSGLSSVTVREKEQKKMSVFTGTYADELAKGEL